MAFSTAITGLKASQTELDVTGNNIANSSTVGFKAGRTEFGDIFSNVVVGAGSSNNAGNGVTVTDIAQDFTAGTIEFTNNNLDLAIDGTGFFQLRDGQGEVTYTRAGGFELDKDGFVVSKSGSFLQGFGLDDQGNRLPVGNLAVDEKESAPQATTEMDLSFNINTASNADGLVRPYNPDNPATFSFSTTNRTFDSLGNENTIKFDVVEQPAVRERQVLDFQPHIDDLAAGVATEFNIAGVTVAVPSGSDLATELATGTPTLQQQIRDQYAGTQQPIASIDFDAAGPTPNQVTITWEASAANVSPINAVPTATAASQVPVDITSSDVSASEVQSLVFDSDADANGSITLGSGAETFTLDYSNGDTVTDILNAFVANQNDIVEALPRIDSLEADTANNRLLVTYDEDAGGQNLLTIAETTTGTGTPVFKTTSTGPTDPGHPNIDGSGATDSAEPIEAGDNSFQGVYQMYAYLNGDSEQLLDIGKAVDPGDAGFTTGQTEPGPVIMRFDNSTGELQSVNGPGTVSATGQVDPLTILNADPADPTSEIELDLTNTTQFASDSIVKSFTQDGFTKGDLIGVSFAEDGTMVASFSNGQNSNLGVVALATFENQGGLQPTGNTEWTSTLESGQAILNPPGTGLNGSLRSSALEQSNVDLSEELVALIQAQRNFQANSKTLQTENTVTQSILQIN